MGQNFSVDYFTGEFYEIYIYDYFEDPICPNRRCMHTINSFNESIGAYGQLLENFTLECADKLYLEPIYENFTNITGFTWMFWDGLTDWIYPNAIIGVSENTVYNNKLQKSQYEWFVEFQCMDESDFVYYIGINAYANVPNPSQNVKNNILNAIKQADLQQYTEDKLFHEVNQTNCTYPYKL